MADCMSRTRSFIARCMYKFFIDGTLKSYGVILEKTVEDLNTAHSLIGWSFSLQIGACYLISPIAGILAGILSYQTLGILGGLIVGTASIGPSLFSSQATWQLFPTAIMSGCGFGMLNIATILSLKNTFDSSYPLVYSTTLLSANLGVSTLPLLLEYLLRSFNKRIAMAIFGLLTCLLILVGIMIPLETRDIDVDNTKDRSRDTTNKCKASEHDDQKERELLIDENVCKSTKQGLLVGHPGALLLVCLHVVYDFNYAGWSIFLVPYGVSLGLESATAVWLSTFGGLGGLSGRLFCMFLCYSGYDGNIYGVALPTFIVAVGISLSLISYSFTTLLVVAFLSGFGLAAQASSFSAMVPSFVCKHHFKSCVVLMYTVGGVMSQLGGITTGFIDDETGSYRLAFILMGALSLLQCIVAVICSCYNFSSESSKKECLQ